MDSQRAPGSADAQRVGAVNVAGVHVAPDFGQDRHGFAVVVGQAGNTGRIDGAGRGAAKNRERVVPPVAGEFGHSEQKADLISRSCPAARHDQRGSWSPCLSRVRHAGSVFSPKLAGNPVLDL
jgi:hypothetical protein